MKDSLMTKSAPLNRRRFLINSAMAAGATLGAGSLLDACNTSNPTTSGSSTATTVTVMYNTGEFTPAHVTQFHQPAPRYQNQSPHF